MQSDSIATDRRRHLRFPAPERAVAVERNSNKLGQIQDISMGGLSFRYIDAEGGLGSSGSLMDIVDTESGFYLKEIPFEIVADFLVDDLPSFSALPVRQCSVRFGELKDAQRSLLEAFLSRCGDLGGPV
ncbi:MAG: PilZ domain-containing protein [Desulfobacteraceae bacterium]